MTKPKILIVEDELIAAIDLKGTLVNLGYNVFDIISSGEDALKKIAALKPDLVLMDIKLKGKMNGIETAGQVHAIYDVPIVYLTAYADQDSVEKAKKTEPYGFIYKPFQVGELKAVIETALYKHGMEKELRKSEEKYRGLFEYMSSGVAVYEALDNGKDFIFKDFNRVAEKIDNINIEKVIGKSVLKVFPRVKEFGLFDIFQKVWKTGKPQHHPVTLYKDERIAGWRKNYVYKLPTGEIVAMYDDITERKQVDMALELSVQKWEDTFNAISDSVSLIDNEGTILQCNKATFKLLDKTAKEVIGEKCWQVVHGKEKPIDECPIVRMKKTKHMESSIIQYGDKWIEVTVNPIFDNEKNIVTAVHIIKDITERKDAEETLRESEERLSLALESTGLGLWDQNFETNKIIRNERWAEMLGYESKDIDSDIKGLKNLIHPDDRTKVYDAMKDHELGKTEHFNIEHRMKTKTGDWKWILNWGKIVCRDKEGAPVRALGTHLDITERKQAEEAQRQSEEKYRALYSNVPLPYQSLNEDACFMDVNLAWLKTLGYEREEIIGKWFGDFIHPDWKLNFEKNFPEFIKRGYVHDMLFKIRHRDGHYLDISLEGSIGYTLDGKFKQTYCVFQDITKRKRAELEADEYRKELQNLSALLMDTQEEERKKISQELHDELGQALTALAINLSIIEKSLPTEGDPQFKERLAESTKLVDDMSDQLHEMILDLRPLMLDDLGLIPTLRWYIKRFKDRTQIKVGLLMPHLKQRLSREIEIVLYRIIQEALTNTAKHTKAKNVQISINRRTTTIEVTIEDDGQGFDLKALSRDPVYQRGVGLLGMRERLLSVQGKFDIKSKKGKGTRLEITIPLGDGA